ncbi:MAG: hypothetical protein GPI91_19780 [Microcystis aeruginosa K13-10]|nr:hypothetical protein [Microcystis aeruginosa K13-10]
MIGFWGFSSISPLPHTPHPTSPLPHFPTSSLPPAMRTKWSPQFIIYNL